MENKKLKTIATLFLAIIIILMQTTIIQNPAEAAASNGYLVLVEDKDGTWTSYKNYVEVSPKNKLMVKASSLSKAIGMKYKKTSSKKFYVANGKSQNIYTLGKINYTYSNGTKTLTKKSDTQPYTSKIFKANMISYKSLNTLIYTDCYQGTAAGTYQDAGYDGVLCFSKYNAINKLPEPEGESWDTVKGYKKINDFMQVKMVLADENTTTAPNLAKLKRDATSYNSDLYYGTDYCWDTPDGPKDLYSNIKYGSGEVELHYFAYISKVEKAVRNFGVGINTEFAEVPKNKNEGDSSIETFTLAAGSIIEWHVKFNIDLMNTAIGSGKQKVYMTFDDVLDMGFLNLYTNIPTGKSFSLTQGLNGSDVTCSYLYVGGNPYAVEYYFTLETGDYGGTYTLSFPNDTSTDQQTFTAKAKSVYQLTYTYGIKYSSSYDYKYKLEFSLSGPQSASITTNDRHPGKLTIGSLKVENTK